MKCFKCPQVFPNPIELLDHIKNDHGLCGKNEFACLQCGLACGDVSVFKNHLKNCKRVSLEDHQDDAEPDAINVNESGSSEDFDMFFDTADGFDETSDCIIETAGDGIIVEVQTAEDETTTELQTIDNEAGVDVHGMTVESDQLKLKSFLASWDVSPLYENLTACGINCENMCYLESRDLEIILGNDKHLLGSMIKFRHLLRQWSTDSTSNRPDALKKNSTFVDVINILNHSAEGKTFISNYKKYLLDDDLRHKLVFIILKETFSKGMTLSRLCLNDMAKQICQIFTQEKKHVYYQKLRKRQPTGILYVKYTNMRHAQLQMEGKMASNDTNNESEILHEECNELQSNAIEIHEVSSNESDQCSTDYAEASLKFIKDYTADCDNELLFEHWKKTFEYRQETFNGYEDIDEVFTDWPPLKRETGHALLCMDFVLKYGVETSNGLNNWNSFFEKNLATVGGIIKDPLMKKNLNGLDSSTSFETKNKIIIEALHHLLVPSATIVNGATWKPTVTMSQQSFLKTVNGQLVMLSDMKKRNNFCKKYGMKNHPVIFEITTCMGTRYNVCIKDVCYTVKSLIEGVDVAYKVFKILNIDFPLECRKVWKFIEHIFYSENYDISGRLLSIVSDMDKNEN